MDARLDNPIWHALTTEQAHLAERGGIAARFPPAFTSLAALAEPSESALAALGRLVRPGETTGLFLPTPTPLPPSLVQLDTATILQMVHDGPAPVAPARPDIVTLDDADAPSMRALAEVTRPGPFGARTHELGTFVGIRDGGRVIAMAGQRMRLPDLIEVSAVCTDPAHLGRGHAAALLTTQLALLRGAGPRVFLHVLASNDRAITLYTRLGFRPRREFRYVIVRGVQG